MTTNRIRNLYVRRSVGVASIVDKIKMNRFRCFSHVMRKENSVVSMVMELKVKEEEEEDQRNS